MDHVRIMGFLVLLWITQFALQFAEARVLEHHFLQHNSAAILPSDLDAVAVDSSTGGRGHVTNYSESNRGSNYGNSTHAANNTIIRVELLQKEATPEDGCRSQAPAGMEEVATIEGNADTLHQILKSHSSHTSVNDGIQGNILSSSGYSPGVGHWKKSKSKSKSNSKDSTSPASNVLSSGPSPGAGNAHTTAVGATQSESNAFNKLPSGPSPGVGHKVSNSYTEKAQAVSITQESELKKKMTIMNNILPAGPSPGVGNSATNGRNLMENGATKDEEIMVIQTFPASNVLPSGPSPGVGGKGHTSPIGGTQSELGTFNKLPTGSSPGVGHKVTNSYTEIAQDLEAKKRGIMNKLPSGPSPGVGNSATNGRNTMEKTIRTEKDEEGLMGIQTFNRLPSGPSPGIGHSYTNAHVTANVKIASSSEDRKGHTSAIGGTQSELGTFNKLPTGSSPGVGHKVTNGYTEIAQESEAKKRGIMNKLPSGQSPGVGNSATNGRNTMEKTISTEKDEEGLTGIQTFNRLPSGPSPGVGHSYTNAHVTANVKLASSSEDRKGSEDAVPIFHKLPGGPSPGGGHSSTLRMQLSSTAPMKISSSPSPGDGNSSMNKLKPARGSQKKKVEQTAGALDRKIGCDGGGLEFYGTPTPPMFGIAAAAGS